MPSRRLVTLAAFLAVVAIVGCSSDESPDSSTTTTTAAPAATATSAAPADTTTTTATPVTAVPGQPPTTPTEATAQEAGQRLLDAWQALDINAAVAVAGSDVANALFSYPTPERLESLPCRGSETVVSAIECDYQDTAGTITLLITGNAGNGYRVTNVGFVPAE